MALSLSALRVAAAIYLPLRRFLVLISVRVDPRAIVRLEGLGLLKNPISLTGIEISTSVALFIQYKAGTTVDYWWALTFAVQCCGVSSLRCAFSVWCDGRVLRSVHTQALETRWAAQRADTGTARRRSADEWTWCSQFRIPHAATSTTTAVASEVLLQTSSSDCG
jgi:hypothetical protein